MFSGKNFTLAVSNLIFLGVGAALWFSPLWAIVIYPVFALIFYWTDFMLDDEMHVIFLFMTTAAALVLASQASDVGVRVGLIIEMLGIILISLAVGFHRSRLSKTRHQTFVQAQELDAQIRDLDRDLSFYGAFDVSAANQIQFRRDLTDAAKSLGSTLDPREVQARLLRVLERRYPTSRVHILPGRPQDPVVNWAMETRSSVLIKDIHGDERFAGTSAGGFRSAVVAPLMVLKRPYGFLRIEDDRACAFQSDDLRTVDLFATLASLTLENIRFLENVNDLATHDALTQLYTHRAFQGRLQEEILRDGRAQMPLSLILCDVDHFKRYNDAFGHQAGDLLLRTVAEIFSNMARPVDFVARYGGEEFSLILPGFVQAQAVDFAHKLRLRVAEEPFIFQGQRTGVTVSFGVASFPQDAVTPSQLVRAADERLYQAKAGGRNQVIG